MPESKVKIKTEFIKLEQLLKLSGAVRSGGEAKSVIKNSSVKVNGEICLQRGKKLHEGDKISIDGRVIEVCK